MAKDPAFLFYPGDWQGGTMTMSRHIKGCYIDLLVAQFNSGPLSLEEIKIVLGNDFAVWGALSKKFKQTETGLFFNERLESEKTKRKEFTIKQKERIEKRWNKSGNDSGNTVVLPFKNENENKDLIKKPIKDSKVIFPYDSENFKEIWGKWKDYRKEIKKPIRGEIEEQTALKAIFKKAKDEKEAVEIIEQSIENGWQGLFKIKDNDKSKGFNGVKKGIGTTIPTNEGKPAGKL